MKTLLLVACATWSVGARAGWSMFPLAFEEEKQRELWDRGCADWPEGVEALGPPRALEMATEKDKGAFRVFGKVRVEREKGETPQKLLASVESALFDGKTYPAWVLPGINEHPEGRYFVSVEGLEALEFVKNERYVLNGGYGFKFLWFSADGISSVLFRKDEKQKTPPCPLFKHFPTATKITYRMTPRPGLLDLLMAELWILPKPDTVEVRFRLTARPSPVVYELLPNKLVQNQLAQRGRRIFANFLDYRRMGKVPESKH